MDKEILDEDSLLQDNELGGLINYLKGIVRKIEKRVGKVFNENLLRDAPLQEHIGELKKYLEGFTEESNPAELQTLHAAGGEKNLEEQMAHLKASFIYVKGFYRKDGRFVKPHYRSRRKRVKGQE